MTQETQKITPREIEAELMAEMSRQPRIFTGGQDDYRVCRSRRLKGIWEDATCMALTRQGECCCLSLFVAPDGNFGFLRGDGGTWVYITPSVDETDPTLPAVAEKALAMARAGVAAGLFSGFGRVSG